MTARTKLNGRWGTPRTLAWGLFAAGLAVVAIGPEALEAGGKASASISTQGVVVFGEAVTGSGTNGTYRMNPDGSGVTLVTTQWYPNDVSRGQSPVTILINTGQDIYAQRADGVGTPVALLVSSTPETQLRFSLDGTKIAYRTAIAGSPTSYTISTADVVRNGSNEVTGLTNTSVVWSGTAATWGLDFSREGTQIVFSASTGGGNRDLFLLTLSDGSVAQLTNTPQLEQFPRWSPTDDRIAYHATPEGFSAVGSLRTIDATTNAVKTVLSGNTKLYATMPCWSPDANYLLALVNSGADLYQFPSGGGRGVNVTGGTSLQPNVPCWGW